MFPITAKEPRAKSPQKATSDSATAGWQNSNQPFHYRGPTTAGNKGAEKQLPIADAGNWQGARVPCTFSGGEGGAGAGG